MTILAPAKRPCASCPYRRDAPSGMWSKAEYDKLPGFDNETAAQPMAVFMCHQQNDRLCAGWVACHDMEESLGLRIAQSAMWIDPITAEAIRAYTTDVAVFGSGAEAAAHGMRELDKPSDRTKDMVEKVMRKRGEL